MYEFEPLQIPGDVDEAELATLLGVARIGVGAAMFLAPRRTARLWLGHEGSATVTTMTMRSLGGRDAALGIGLLMALQHDVGVRGWLEAGAMCDAVDGVATLLSYRRLPRVRRIAFLAACVGGAVLQARLAPSFD